MVEVQKLVTCITKHDKIRAMGRKACMRKGWIGFAENMLKKLNNGGSKKMFILTLHSEKIKRGEVFFYFFFFSLVASRAYFYVFFFFTPSQTRFCMFFLCIFVPSFASPLTDVFPLQLTCFCISSQIASPLFMIMNPSPFYSTPLKSCFCFH